jgi:hypothetical protein
LEQTLLMRKVIFFLSALLAINSAWAQVKQKQKPIQDTVRKSIDSAIVEELKDNALDNIPTISLDDNDFGDGANAQNISSILTAGRDPFFSASAFNFSPARFRMRGYDNDLNATFMNGIPMDNLDNGFTPFGLWGGLNDVMRNRDLSIGLRYNTFSFGDIGSSTSIDSRASKQREQTQVGYSLSNRNYTHRVNVYHGSGISKKGWAYVVAGSFRGADEGYVPGTYYNGYSYFLGLDKRFGQKHLLSLVAFGAPTENGRQTAAVQEAMDLVGTNYYNPAWGYQNGKKRNANVAKTHQPYIILTHDFRISNKSSLVTAIGYSFGERATTALDWNNSADPRPDYYRYLPSYQLDPTLRQRVADDFATNPSTSQINWDKLYLTNYGSFETIKDVNGVAGNNVSGKRSRYIVEERTIDTKRFNVNIVFNKKINNHLDYTAGASFQNQKNNYFKRVGDLLGGEFYVDLNQFGERDFPTNPLAAQNNVLAPNRILRKDDKFGYNYDINIQKSAAWQQFVLKYNKIDLFVSAEISNTQFYRNGNYQNGLYLNNSYGKSTTYNFNNYAVKGGITYKIDGRNYLYVDGAMLTRAPYFDNVYTSPRTRDLVQDNVTSEKISSLEGGYVLNAPKIKVRLTGYYTKFEDQMNVITFYHDDYRNFVNYAVNNIDKVHFGAELGFDVKIMRNLSLVGAAAVGRYYFDSQQQATVTQDNSAVVLSKETVYSENFRVGGTPQEAYSLGISYRSPKFWYFTLTGNYFDQMWLDFNPIRRTEAAVNGVAKDSDKWNEILNQTRLKGQATLDFFGGYSYRLPRQRGSKHSQFLVFNVGVNNLLNNKQMITGGFEQLRFDFDAKNVNKFPPKLFYAYGTNFFASIIYRFQ